MISVTIEGLPGVGKSRVCRDLGMPVLEEQAETDPFLVPVYQDASRWGLAFQLSILERRMTNLAPDGVLEGQAYVLDRSLYGDFAMAFALFTQGHMTQAEWDLYDRWWLRVQAVHWKAGVLPTVMVYLDASPQTCLARMGGRGRDGEGGATLRHLQACRDSYEWMLTEMASKVQIHRIPWDPFGDVGSIKDLLRSAPR